MNFFNVGCEALDGINTVIMEMVRRSKVNLNGKELITGSIEELMEKSTGLEDFYSSLLVHDNNMVVDLRKGFPMESKFLQYMLYDKDEYCMAETDTSVCIIMSQDSC